MNVDLWTLNKLTGSPGRLKAWPTVLGLGRLGKTPSMLSWPSNSQQVKVGWHRCGLLLHELEKKNNNQGILSMICATIWRVGMVYNNWTWWINHNLLGMVDYLHSGMVWTICTILILSIRPVFWVILWRQLELLLNRSRFVLCGINLT